MIPNRFQDDLLHDFREQEKMIDEQLALCEAMAASMRKHSSKKINNKTELIIYEILLYLLSAASIAFAFLMQKIYPFTVLSDLLYESDSYQRVGGTALIVFNLVIHLMPIGIGLLFFAFACNMRSIRMKNFTILVFDKNLRPLTASHLKRKAAIDTIDQRYFTELPALPPTKNVNTVPNPGFDVRDLK